MPDLEMPVQRIRAFVRDHILEPDAMRGSEHYLRNIKDADGNAITPVDEEEARRQFAADAVQSRAPIRVTSSSSQSSAQDVTPPSVPVSEAPGSSPNIQRAPVGAGTVAPVVTDPGIDWQARARAEGWTPRDESSRPRHYDDARGTWADNETNQPVRVAPPTMTPVPNAEPAYPAPQTAPPPSPANSEGSVGPLEA